ncbi:MAG: type II secretion system protein GspM [Pseudomonadota bacterium]|nr:type II secretion system protein GspM [Pseudomonadota bacterium]
MNPTVRKRSLCILAWSAVILIPVALILGVGLPWLERMHDLDRTIASLDDQLVRYHRLLQTLPGLKAELEQVRSNEEVKGFFFDAQTPAIAGAQLQRQIQDMIEAAGGRLVSTQILPTNDKQRPVAVRVRTQMQGQTDALMDVLYRIEQARPFLFIDQVSVRSTHRAVSTRAAAARKRRSAAQKTRQGNLTIRLDVFGYSLGETS